MKGVYFSANDAVLPWVMAFVRSLRAQDVDLRLILIPFDENCEALLQFCREQAIEVYDDLEGFKRLEAIGAALELGHSAYGPYWFRRYAAFWGPLDKFIYLDARQLVLGTLEPFFDGLAQGLDLVYYDVALNQVYEPGPVRTQFLLEGRARGFNSGRWASRKGLFSIEDFERYTQELLKVREQMNPRNTDQFFINYCCDQKQVKYAQVADLDGGLCQIGWAGQRGEPYQDRAGVWRLWDYGGLDHRKQLMLLNWAGYPLESWIPHFKLLEQYGIQLSLADKMKGYGKGMIRKAKANRWINQRFSKQT
jgi:hypothetical protein